MHHIKSQSSVWPLNHGAFPLILCSRGHTHIYNSHRNPNFLHHCAVKLGDITLQEAHLNASQSKGMREWGEMSHPLVLSLHPFQPTLFSHHCSQWEATLCLFSCSSTSPGARRLSISPAGQEKHKNQPCSKADSAQGLIEQSNSFWATPVSMLTFFFPFIFKPVNI